MYACTSGGGGIRTPGTREGTPVFETGAFNQAPPPHRGVADVLYLPPCPAFRSSGSNYGERGRDASARRLYRPNANPACPFVGCDHWTN